MGATAFQPDLLKPDTDFRGPSKQISNMVTGWLSVNLVTPKSRMRLHVNVYVHAFLLHGDCMAVTLLILQRIDWVSKTLSIVAQ